MAKARQGQDLVWLDSESLLLPAMVTVETASGILRQVKRDNQQVKSVDFSDVTQVDSVALAMLLAWQSQIDTSLKIIALPDELKTLVHLYDLEGVLSV